MTTFIDASILFQEISVHNSHVQVCNRIDFSLALACRAKLTLYDR